MIFVYYHDDYYESGGVGLRSFESVEEAEKFILERLNASEGRTLYYYTVIEGKKIPIEIVETVSKIRLDI